MIAVYALVTREKTSSWIAADLDKNKDFLTAMIICYA